jgi:4-hydroxy-3-polyprenylbenzoate decarboxylase
VRETPLRLGHLRPMVNVAEVGVVIHPPMSSFYNKPQSLYDIVNFTVGLPVEPVLLKCAHRNTWPILEM